MILHTYIKLIRVRVVIYSSSISSVYVQKAMNKVTFPI